MPQTHLGCLLVAFLIAGALPAQAGEAKSFPWDRVPDVQLEDYKPELLGRAVAKFEQIKSYGRCQESIAVCLRKDPAHATAARLARDVFLLLAASSSDEEIQKWVDARKAMAQPKPEDVRGIDLEGLSPLGDPKAPVVVVEYSDFQCPFCASISPIIERVIRDSGGKARLYFKQFPIKGHPRAVVAAQACIAADAQKKFWDYCLKLFTIQSDLSDDRLAELARETGLDVDRFKKDMASDSALDRIADEKMEGLRNRVQGTPTIFINGKELLLHPTTAMLKDRIAEELDILNGRD